MSLVQERSLHRRKEEVLLDKVIDALHKEPAEVSHMVQ